MAEAFLPDCQGSIQPPADGSQADAMLSFGMAMLVKMGNGNTNSKSGCDLFPHLFFACPLLRMSPLASPIPPNCNPLQFRKGLSVHLMNLANVAFFLFAHPSMEIFFTRVVLF